MANPIKPPQPSSDPPQSTAFFTDVSAPSRHKQRIGRRMIHEAAEYVKSHISRQPPVQRVFSFMPTLLTQVSPFHFKPRSKYSDWPLVRLDSGTTNSWGRMTVVGELLVIFDESVLFGLLMLMSASKSEAFETTLKDICRINRIQPTDHQCSAVWRSIQRLAGTRIDLSLTSGKGKKQKTLKRLTGSILSFADLSQDTGSVRVVVNPYFIELYADSFVTNIDLTFRSSLKHDLSKTFYRFYQGLYESESVISVSHLARAVNLPLNQPNHRLRAKVRAGLTELRDRNYLTAFEITKDNMVRIQKASGQVLNFSGRIPSPGRALKASPELAAEDPTSHPQR